jgi:hypothetical protein
MSLGHRGEPQAAERTCRAVWLSGEQVIVTPTAPRRIALVETYEEVIRLTEGMVGDRQSQQLAGRHGLQILNVTWEDTARFKGSAVGPNISDMTIQVQRRVPRTDRSELTCMPVIRYPNFADLSADIGPQFEAPGWWDDFWRRHLLRRRLRHPGGEGCCRRSG